MPQMLAHAGTAARLQMVPRSEKGSTQDRESVGRAVRVRGWRARKSEGRFIHRKVFVWAATKAYRGNCQSKPSSVRGAVQFLRTERGGKDCEAVECVPAQLHRNVH